MIMTLPGFKGMAGQNGIHNDNSSSSSSCDNRMRVRVMTALSYQL